MKLRIDFVTNSSSSSFVLCNKGVFDVDQFLEEFSNQYDKYIDEVCNSDIDFYTYNYTITGEDLSPEFFYDGAETKDDVINNLREELESEGIKYYYGFMERDSECSYDPLIEVLNSTCREVDNSVVSFLRQ